MCLIAYSRAPAAMLCNQYEYKQVIAANHRADTQAVAPGQQACLDVGDVVVARDDDIAAARLGHVPRQRVDQRQLRRPVALPVVTCGRAYQSSASQDFASCKATHGPQAPLSGKNSRRSYVVKSMRCFTPAAICPKYSICRCSAMQHQSGRGVKKAVCDDSTQKHAHRCRIRRCHCGWACRTRRSRRR